MVKKLMVLLSIGMVAALCACAASEPARETAPSTAETTTEAAEESELAGAHAFGETVQMDLGGSAWEITIGEPVDAPGSLEESFDLDPGMRYVAVPGRVVRVDGPSTRPIKEINIDAVVNSVLVTNDYLSDDEYGSLNAVPEMFAGGDVSFNQVFAITEGDTIETIRVTLGKGDDAKAEFFGEPVESIKKPRAQSTVGIGQLMAGWLRATDEQRAQSFETWGLSSGEVADVEIQKFIEDSRSHGAEFTEDEAREFLEWVLTQ